MNLLHDERVDCYSALINLQLGKFLSLVDQAHKTRGGIEGQRDALKTSTAKRIRKRLVEDLVKGAILPPIVVGVIVTPERFAEVSKLTEAKFIGIIDSTAEENISIIDGMQRTTALLEATKSKPDLINKKVRVEFWVTTNVNSLIYRMLVLNTGQVPWNLRRQMEVVFKSMKTEIRKNVPPIEVLEVDEKKKRTKPAQYQASDLIELFLIFGSKKPIIDTREQLAEEFTRLDVIEGTEIPEFTTIYYNSLSLLAELDIVFDKFKATQNQGDRFTDGKDLFSGQTARAGLIASIAAHTFGRPGVAVGEKERKARWEKLAAGAKSFLDKLQALSPKEIGQFLDFETLNEKLLVKSPRVGEFERNFFTKAFSTLIEEEFRLDSLNPCWRAY